MSCLYSNILYLNFISYLGADNSFPKNIPQNLKAGPVALYIIMVVGFAGVVRGIGILKYTCFVPSGIGGDSVFNIYKDIGGDKLVKEDTILES